MNNAADETFPRDIVLEDGTMVSCEITFQEDRYVVYEPISGWIAHFVQSGQPSQDVTPIVSSDKKPNGIDPDALIRRLMTLDDKGLFQEWVLWKDQL